MKLTSNRNDKQKTAASKNLPPKCLKRRKKENLWPLCSYFSLKASCQKTGKEAKLSVQLSGDIPNNAALFCLSHVHPPPGACS